MKKKILISIAAIIIVAGIWAAFNREKFTQSVVDLGMALTSSIKHRNPATEKAKFEMSTDQFAKAFKENAGEATKKYINQAILLEGTITAISGVTISFNNIACNIDSAEVTKLKDLKTGSTIKLQGLLVGYNDLMDEVVYLPCCIWFT